MASSNTTHSSLVLKLRYRLADLLKADGTTCAYSESTERFTASRLSDAINDAYRTLFRTLASIPNESVRNEALKDLTTSAESGTFGATLTLDVDKVFCFVDANLSAGTSSGAQVPLYPVTSTAKITANSLMKPGATTNYVVGFYKAKTGSGNEGWTSVVFSGGNAADSDKKVTVYYITLPTDKTNNGTDYSLFSPAWDDMILDIAESKVSISTRDFENMQVLQSNVGANMQALNNIGKF